MPFTALLPPTVWPTWTKADELAISGLGRDKNVQVGGASGAAVIQSVGGSNTPGAKWTSPYSMTRTFSARVSFDDL